MKTIMVKYRTTPEHAAANEAAIRAVFDELRSRTPAGLRYTSFRTGDDGTFIHVASVDAPENPLLTLPAFLAFQKQLQGRFVDPPVTTELRAVDSYGGAIP
jgi:hypothetical protein